LEEPEVGVFGGRCERIFARVLTQEAEEDAGKRGVQSVRVRKDFEFRFEGQQMGHTGWVGAAEEVLVGLRRAAL
jgi:hypothetical protein